jgi:hypothetical protein
MRREESNCKGKTTVRPVLPVAPVRPVNQNTVEPALMKSLCVKANDGLPLCFCLFMSVSH